MNFNEASTEYSEHIDENEMQDLELEEYLFILNAPRPNQNEIENNARRKQKINAAIQRRILKEQKKNKQAGFEFHFENFKPNIPETLILDSQQDIIINKLYKSKYLEEMLKFLQTKVYKNYGQFNEEETIALFSNKNFILLGRSGTGKTFVILNKIFLNYLVSCNKIIKSFHNIEQVTIRTVFTTSSDFLIKSSKNYYKILDKKFKQNKNDINYENASNETLEKFFTEKENFDSYQTFYNITKNDYPLFLPFLVILRMIDSTLTHPFFCRDKNGKVFTTSLDINYYSEENRTYLISDEILKKIFKKNYMCLDTKHYISRNMKCASLEAFINKFWNHKKYCLKENRLNALLVWSEIMSYIKGSSYSYQRNKLEKLENKPDNKQENWHLKKEDYLHFIGRHRTFLSEEEKSFIWDIAQEYEIWKVKENMFDWMDVVSYILNEIDQDEFIFPNKPHAIFVDEVQDMAPSISYLLKKISLNQIIFSGDTAQTIAKGMNFRFSDLQSFNYKEELLDVVVLKINYRSQANIIALGNLMIILLEIFFPASLDIVAKEKSLKKGIKPILSSNPFIMEYIVRLFANKEECPKEITQITYAILVRDMESKLLFEKRFPNIRSILLTIYEAKGLEFDYVIIYNFFESSSIPSKIWEKFSSIFFYDNKIDSYSNRQEYVKSNYSFKISQPLSQEHEDLKDELKMLYTAITRAKLHLVIHDDSSEKRKSLEKLMDFFHLIEFEDYLPSFKIRNNEILKEIVSSEFLEITMKDGVTSDLKIINQAMRYYELKMYEQAYILFEKIGCFPRYEKICKAFYFVEKAKSLENDGNYIDAIAKYKETAKIFEDLSKNLKPHETDYLKDAAKCYFSSIDFEKASILFESKEMWDEAGESILELIQQKKIFQNNEERNLYLKAYKLFEKNNNIDKMIYCLDCIKEYKTILLILYENENRIVGFQNYVKKYLILFFKEKIMFYYPDFEQKCLEYPGAIKVFEHFKYLIDFYDILFAQGYKYLKYSDNNFPFFALDVFKEEKIKPFINFLFHENFWEMGAILSLENKFEDFFKFFMLFILMDADVILNPNDNENCFKVCEYFEMKIDFKISNLFKNELQKKMEIIKPLFFIKPILFFKIEIMNIFIGPFQYPLLFTQMISQNKAKNNIFGFLLDKKVLENMIKNANLSSYSYFINENIRPILNYVEKLLTYNLEISQFKIIVTEIVENFCPGFSRVIFENKFEMLTNKYLIPVQNKKIQKFIRKYFSSNDEKEEENFMVFNDNQTVNFVALDILILFTYSKIFHSVFHMVNVLEKELTKKCSEESFYLEIYYLASQLKRIAKLVNSHMLKRKELLDLNSEEIHNNYLISEEGEEEKTIKKMRNKINYQEVKILDKLASSTKEQIILQIKTLKSLQYNLIAFFYSKKKDNANKKIIFDPLISTIYYKFSIRDKLAVEYIIKNKKIKIPLKIINKIFSKNFKGKKLDFKIMKMLNKKFEIDSEENYNLLYFFFLHYGEVLKTKEDMEKYHFNYNEDSKINELFYKVLCLPKLYRSFNFLYFEFLLSSSNEYFCITKWKKETKFQISNYFYNKKKISEFYYEILEKIRSFENLSYQKIRIICAYEKWIKKILAEATILALIYFTKNNEIIPFDLLFQEYITNLFVTEKKHDDFSIIFSFFDSKYYFFDMEKNIEIYSLFYINLKILETIVEIIFNLPTYDDFVFALFQNILQFFENSWLFSGENNELEEFLGNGNERIYDEITLIKTKVNKLETKMSEIKKKIKIKDTFFVVIPMDSLYDFKYLNEWGGSKKTSSENNNDINFSVLDFLILRKTEEISLEDLSSNIYDKKKIELARIFKNSIKKNFEALYKFSAGKNFDKKKRIFSLYDLEHSLEKINQSEKSSVLGCLKQKKINLKLK